MALLALLAAAVCPAQTTLELAGVSVTPHVTTDETRYRGRATPAGAWVQIVLRNPTDRPLAMPDMVNGREPFQWVLTGEWSWSDAPRFVPAGGYGVLSFNGVTPQWREGAALTLEHSRRGGRVDVRLPARTTVLRKVSFFPTRNEVAVHTSGAALEQVTLRTGAGFTEVQTLTRKHGALFSAESLKPGAALVEARFADGSAQWALLRIKDDGFDIGAGWLDTRAPNGVNPLEVPLFRSLLRRLHINLTHSQNDPAPDGRPLRRMSTFADVKKFSAPEEVATIHCADVVGEPQHSQLTPWEVFRRLKPYDAGLYPTCLTLSEDLGFGFYAGLSDWPHFDAYRVNAPHADNWAGYERFGGLTWGAPLESVGAMMRVLNEISRPRPVAAWSQSAHYNWRAGMGGRQRLDPTPDEMRMQAWQVIANGAQSLYWYSLESYSALRSPDLLEPTMHIGRQIRAMQEILETGDATWHARRDGFDFNVVAAPEAAALFALDIDYRAGAETKTFVWNGSRTFEAEFELPEWLRGEGLQVFRLTPDNVEEVAARSTVRGVRFHGEANVAAIFIASKNKNIGTRLKQSLEALKEAEAAEPFDLDRLAEALGYARILR